MALEVIGAAILGTSLFLAQMFGEESWHWSMRLPISVVAVIGASFFYQAGKHLRPHE